MFFASQRRALIQHLNFQSGPGMRCFVHFDLDMCLAPQQRALFRHHNFQKRSEREVLLHLLPFYFQMCFAPQQRAFFSSPLTTWLRTRRFSEPTFRPSRATNHWKNIVNRDFPTFSRPCLFFLLTLSSLWSSLWSSLFFSSPPDSSHLCFSNCPYCRKFHF